MSRYYRHLIQNGLLLDTYPNARVAYSLRKLRDGYTGSAIRVRRNSDNVEQDFGFDSNGNLDTISIENFVGWNLFAWSEQLQQSYWSKSQVNVTTDALVAPNGSTTGDILYETTTVAAHTLSRSISVTAGEEYTVSFWVQAQGRTFVRLTSAFNLSWDGVTNPIAWLNLSTGTIVSQNAGYGGTVQISSAPNGWYFVSLKVKAATTASSTLIVFSLSPDGSTVSYAGNTSLGIAIWGLQVTQSSVVRPYQQTGANGNGNGFIAAWYDQSGNGFTATQGTISSQAQIAQNGYVIKNVLNKITSRWSTSWYIISSSPADLQGSNFSISVMGKTVASNLVSFGNTSIGGRPRFPIWVSTGNIDINTINYGSDTGLGIRLISSYVNSGIGGVFVNGSPLVNTPSPMTDLPSSNCTTIGRFTSTGGSSGELQEMIWWKQNLLSFRTGIEQNVNNYYGIY